MATKSTVTVTRSTPPPVTAESIARSKAAANAERDAHYRLTGEHIDADGFPIHDERQGRRDA